MGLRIVPNSDEYYQESIRIYNESFLPKFRFVSNREELQASFVHDYRVVALDVKDKEYVALEDGAVLGILSLTFHEQGKLEIRPNLTYGQLLGKYGLLGLLKAALLGMIITYNPPKGEMYIDNVGVSRDARGKGVGRQLIAFAEDVAREKGHKHLSLHVMKENDKPKLFMSAWALLR